MATTAIWDVSDRLKRVLNYAMNPDKTEQERKGADGLQQSLAYTVASAKTQQQLYVSGIHCDPVTAYEDMQQTKRQFQKTGGIVAFHGYQSFAPGETTPEIAHAIGVKLAQTLWGDRFEVVVATHLDKDHVHNHFVLNSISFMDGKRYYDNKASYARMRQASDQLCREHALSVIEQPKHGQSKHYGEWRADQERQPTWRGVIREDVEEALAAARTMSQFYAALQAKGYGIKAHVKHIAIRPPGKTRFVRLRSLGGTYTETAIKQRILNRITAKRLPLPRRKHAILAREQRSARFRKLSGLQALYVRYLYVLGRLPRSCPSPRRTLFLLREDLQHLLQLGEQTKLLCRQRITSREQLADYQQQLAAEVQRISSDRKVIYNRLRRCQQPEKIVAYREEIAAYTRQRAALRKEIKLCAGILARSDTIRDKLRHREPISAQQKAENIQNRGRLR